MEPIWLFKMFIAHFHPLLFYRIKSLVFPVPCHQTTILRTQRPYFHKMATALVEALYLKLFEIQCFPAFSISSCWYYYFTIHIYYPPHPLGVAKNNLSKHCLCHDTGEIPHTFLSSVWSNFHREVSLTLSRFFFGYSSFYRRNALTFPAVFATICYG